MYKSRPFEFSLCSTNNHQWQNNQGSLHAHSMFSSAKKFLLIFQVHYYILSKSFLGSHYMLPQSFTKCWKCSAMNSCKKLIIIKTNSPCFPKLYPLDEWYQLKIPQCPCFLVWVLDDRTCGRPDIAEPPFFILARIAWCSVSAIFESLQVFIPTLEQYFETRCNLNFIYSSS